MHQDTAGIRTAFLAGAEGFADVAGRLGAEAWDLPALGVWTVRDLVGHASRALSTVENYLDRAPSAEVLAGPVAYYLATRSSLADVEAVAQRGRDAGLALGEDPGRAVRSLLERVVERVERAADDAVVTTPVGSMTLLGYLPTRTFELAVHTLDLTLATKIEAPDRLHPAVAASCQLAGQIAARLPNAPELLLAFTGRTGLPPGLSVV